MAFERLKQDEIMRKAEKITSLKDITRLAPRFGTQSMIIGALLVVLGGLGILLPKMVAIEFSLLVGLLFVIGGAMWAAHALRYSRERWGDWLKPVLLLISGGLILFYPMSGVAAVGLLLAFYLLLDAFGSFVLAYGIYPLQGWIGMLINGLISLLLATLFLIGWPESSLYLVGLFVAISLLIDGIALLYIGWLQRNLF